MRVLSNNACNPKLWQLLLMTGLIAGSGSALASPELLDIVARIEYGYYAGDARLISAASTELERLRGNRAAVAYYSGFAAMRLNQVDSQGEPRTKRQRTDRCLASVAELIEEPAWAAEAHVLAAACQLAARNAAGARSVGLNAKPTRSIEAARAIDPDNPRLLLVTALALPVDDDTAQRSARLAALEAALARFDERMVESDVMPRWGRAEVLAQLGALHLSLGDAREARDLIERALIEAPGYDFALRLQKGLSLH